MGPKEPGRASIGSRDGLRFIWSKFQSKWAHLGPNQAPFCFSISPKPILDPNSSSPVWVQGPYGSYGPRAPPVWVLGPMEAEGRLFGGVWGGGSPPTEKSLLELLPIAKSEPCPRVILGGDIVHQDSFKVPDFAVCIFVIFLIC